MLNVNSLTENGKLALLFGILAGDGCLCSHINKKSYECKFITITGGLDDLPFFENIISPLLKHFRGKETKIKFRRDCNAIEFNFSDVNLFNLLSSVGFPIGKKGKNIIIPDLFYKKNLLKYVVQGIFATDGSLVLTKNPNKYYPRLEVHLISPKIIFQMHSILLSKGMKGHFYECKRKKNSSNFKNLQTKFRIQFNGKENLLLFEKLIGFINPKHKLKFDNFLEYDNYYTFDKKDFFNKSFLKNMAALGVEPRTSSS